MNINQIKETCLYTRDLEKARHFYHGVIGFPIISSIPGKLIFFRVGKSVLLCFNPDQTKREKSLPPHFAEGPQHIAFEVPYSEYGEWKIFCREAGIHIIHEQDWGNEYHSFYFHDPVGHLLEIVPEGMWEKD